MFVLFILAITFVVLLGGGSLYSRFLARRFGEDPTAVTPATRFCDGRDYVPTPTLIVFAHHFASIAGAGPIVGPVLALTFGWLPALLWVVLGGLFIGGVHDYLAAFMSMRNNGQSIAVIGRRLLGRGTFVALMIFLVLMLGLVTATFLNTSATALVSMLDFGRMKLTEGQTLFRVAETTQLVDGVATTVRKVVIGGVASTSVIVVTALAPLVGWLYIKKQVKVWKCSLLAILICAASIIAGVFLPVAFPEKVSMLGGTISGQTLWKYLLSAYVLIAAGVPVWLFLQSRDFINVHILYAGIAALAVTLVVAALRAPAPCADMPPIPHFDYALGSKYLGLFWPMLFITIACGAVSGFHSLCAGGTTCKQLKSEAATRYIGYWGMLLESLLAVSVICILIVGTNRDFYLLDVFPAGKDNNPVLGFAFAVGSAGNIAFGLPVAAGALAGMLLLEGFVITTLDTAVRLNRYLIEEIWLQLFGRYDVFANRAAISEAACVPREQTRCDGIDRDFSAKPTDQTRRLVQTSGAFRALLKFLRLYWVNSGLAVALMLYLSVSAGILQLWGIFATANQLLAAFVLALGTIWLIRQGRRTWYVMIPALFMLATTIGSLVVLFKKFMPREEGGKSLGNPTLFAADIVLLALTLYLVCMGIREMFSLLWARRSALQ